MRRTLIEIGVAGPSLFVPEPGARLARNAAVVVLRPEFLEHLAYELAVMPLLVLDLMDPLSLGRVRDTAPVTGVGESRGQFARIGGPEDTDQGIASRLFLDHGVKDLSGCAP